MRLSRTNMPLASSDSVISQLTYAVFLDNLAPHLRAENPDHKLFCHSQPQNPPQLSKSGLAAGSVLSGSRFSGCGRDRPEAKAALFTGPRSVIGCGGYERQVWGDATIRWPCRRRASGRKGSVKAGKHSFGSRPG